MRLTPNQPIFTALKPAKIALITLAILSSYIGFAQEYTSFTRTYPSGNTYRYQNNIKGDLVFIANNIVNRDDGPGRRAEDDYNNTNTNTRFNPASNRNRETGGFYNVNDFKNMQYINVDSGDPANFSSSSATLNFPDPSCSLIRYAGLYWSATYPSATANGSYNGFSYQPNNVPVGTGRQTDFNQVRFRVPGGTYVDITADEVLFDGFTSTDTSVRQNSPYACYADVTAIMTALAAPQGEYTVANIRAVTGSLTPGGGSAGGWTLVVVYENPNVTGKLITTFDGFARVRNTAADRNLNIDYSGFTTIPGGPVRANIGAGALEGDFRIGGDRLFLRENNTDPFVRMSNAANPGNNFFNSNITSNGVVTTNRNPNSINTLGYDTDIFLLNNPANSVIGNNANTATFRFTSRGDQYYPFFNSFNIEIIEPDIVLEKKVEDIAGNDITGLGVNLGQILDYVLSFKNIGNDDATNYTIRDILPINVTLDETNLDMPAGTTYTYNPASREVVFTLPDNIIEIGDPIAQIRMRVQVAENCFDFIDACTDLIQNLAYSTYEGVINDNQITDDPSVSDFDDCGFVTPGATNFLLDDLSDCNFTRTVQLCGLNAILDAGDNFDTYVWVRDDNNNGEIDATDTVQNDGDPDGDPSTISVTETGTYIVDKIVADPCKGFKEIILVERFGATQTNPLVDFFNDSNNDADATNDVQGEIVQCSVDGDLLPKIFLCGASDTQLLQVNIPDAQSLVWEILDESSCTAAPDDCANKNLTCTWNQVGTGGDYTAMAAGKYRLVINYTNGCFSRFYFDVFQNILDVQFNERDIFCTTDGNITITNLGANYGYQLLDVAAGTILIPFSANNGPSFDIDTNGAYRVDVVQLDGSGNPIPGACIFSTPDIGILDRNFQVDIETTPANCNAQGRIKIDILNVRPDYTYVLRLADGTLVDDETAQPDNTHTFNVNPGNYIVEATTADGCTFSQNVEVADTPDPTVLAVTTRNIGCSAGIITLTGSNGFPNPEYSYAIWSKDGTDLYPDVASIPGDAYEASPIFNFGWSDSDNDGTDDLYTSGEDGDYVFVIVDSNNCFAFSNQVTITDNGAMTATVTDDTPVSCSGNNDASFTINTSGGIGPFSYSIDAGATTQPSPSFVNLAAGTYNIQVSDSSGCTLDFTHDIVEPFPLSASAGVSRDSSCDPNGAEVRITNVVGGTAPYQYSFDGGSTYGASTTEILPAGTYTLIVRDATGCTFPMTVTVDNVPPPPSVTLTPEVSYSCDGSATVTATPNITTYNYTYALDGVINTPPESNVFNNVAPGTYTVSTNYVSQTPPAPSLLLSEDFGYGLTIPNPNTSGYFYENQLDNTSPSGAPIDNGAFINDYEYAVTSNIERPFGSWLNPVDHTSGDRTTQGRYLVINIGAPSPGQVIYQMPINDIIPNQPLDVSLWGINLLRSGRNGVEPDLTIELRDPVSDAVVASAVTGAIPENDIWNQYILSLNPGANTTLDLVITTNESEINGNDVAIDDITVYQTPEVCEQTVTTSVVVEAGRVFAANGVGSTNVSCNGLSDGTITFEAENFDATAGFDYSVDGGTTWINSTTSPVTTNAIYGVGLQRIELRKADENTCTSFVEVTISEPAALVAAASITTPINCTNGGATITASVSGGTPGYSYQLEDTAGNAIATYDFATNGANTVFTGIAPDDYIVRVRDNNLCEDPIDVALTIAPTNTIAFDVAPTLCYTGANDAGIQVNVTDGNGDYTFSINGGPWVTPTPVNATTHTFGNLASGDYTINVSDGSGCIGVLQNVSINPQLTVSASAPRISACETDADITITASGGDANYVYAVIPSGNAVVDGDFSITNPATGFTAGTYDVYVRDNGGAADYCFAMFAITISQDPPIATTVTSTNVSCSSGTNGSISISVDSGGTTPFEYSIDNGATYQLGSNFPNLSAGTYQVVVRDSATCTTIAEEVIISEPSALVAFAAVTELVECNPTAGAEVRITNPSGGTPAYEYSFNNGLSFGPSSISNLPAGDHILVIRDASNCTFEMPLTVEPQPTPPNFSDAVVYDCTGEGEITITPDNAGFDYTYSIDGTPNTPDTSNVFSNVAVGTHTITVNYQSNTPPATSTLILEDFGVGVNTPISEIDPLYTYESQVSSIIDDGEYSVTNFVTHPGWVNPADHTGRPNGRFLAINVGGAAGVGGIMYAKRGIEVIPNSDIAINLSAFNLLSSTSGGGDPTIRVELVDPSGTVIQDFETGEVPKNTGPNDWYDYTITLNPGANANLDIVIRTNSAVTGGNDIAIDDINAFQLPIQCPGVANFDVIVEDGNAFEASITAFENLDCNADGSGTITITANNFGTSGYEYSLNGAVFVGPFTAATQITGLAAIAHSVEVRDVDNAAASLPGCTVTLNQTLSEPAVLTASGSVTQELTCAGNDATITASATGGTQTYTYQLEDDLGNIIGSFDFVNNGSNPIFAGLSDGSYIVRARDLNNCEAASAVVVIDPVDTIAFDTTHSVCYDGGNNATITIDVTSGNTGYQFNIDSGSGPGPWITPSPATATTHIFSGLANGTYIVNVRDSKGCGGTIATQQTVSIDPQLVVTVNVDNISACNDGTITANASGGNGTLVYAIVPANTSPTGLYTTTNSLTVTTAMATANPAGYDVYVLDNNGTAPSCSFLQEDIILTPVTALTVTGTATDPECFDGLGSIDATISGGTGPFTYTLVDLSPADGIDYGRTNTNIAANTLPFNGIGVGDYEITVTDTNSCSVTSATITINNATEITADITPELPAVCNDPDTSLYGFNFDNVITPAGTIEYSADGGSTWQPTNELRGYTSGDAVFPSIRVTLASGTICQRDFDRYIIPFPLDNLDISISAVVVDCFDLQVRVQGTAGIAPYEYAFSEDPTAFDPATATWQPGGTLDSGGNTVPAGEGSYTWTGLTPGRTYVFYVRDDTGCVRQSLVNVNDLIVEPIEITTDITPSCFGASTGAITYTLNPGTPSSHMNWSFFEVGNATALQTSGGTVLYNNTITVSGLAEGDYYLEIVQSDGTTDACRGGSENAFVNELRALTATPTVTRDISCNLPGLISIDAISGGGGAPYTYDVTGPAGFTALTGTTDNPVQIPVNSPAGNYTVTLNDQYGCSVTLAPVALTLSPNPTITSVTQDNCSAPIALTVLGSSAAGNIRYAIVPAGNPAPTTYLDNAGLFENVATGSYDIYIIDGNGCTASQATFVVHPVLSASATLTKLLDCTTSADAVITIEALTGSGSYEYSITNTAGAPAVAQTTLPSNPFDYQAPLAGDYTITIYDTTTPNNSACNRVFIVNVPDRLEPIVDVINSTDITCIGDDDGTITISAINNAIGPYTFEITAMDGAAVNINPTSFTNTTATFTGLAPTTTAAGYIVTLTANAANDCSTDSAAITIAEPLGITVTMDTTVEFECVAGNNEQNARISVQSATGGSNTFVRYQFINDLNPGTPVQDGSNDTYIETNLAGGNYTINVYDDNGCFGTTTATIAPFVEISNPTVTVDSDVTCNPGADAQVSIGITFNPSTATPNMQYSVVGTDNLYSTIGQVSNVFTNIGVGRYEVTVTNTDTNCFVQTTFEIEDPNTFEITTDTTDVVCFGDDGSVSFTIGDIVNPYADGFSWQIYDSQGTVDLLDDVLIPAANGVSATVGPTAPFAIGAGDYRVEITQDSDPACVNNAFFVIAGPSAEITASTDVAPITCVGNDGVIEIIDVIGGWGTYEYYVGTVAPADATVFGSNPKFENLAPGTYEAWVIDRDGCQEEIQSAILLADPTPITADLQINQPNCTDLNGEIEVINEAGGQGSNYSYQLQVYNTGTATFENLRPIQTDDVFSGLGAGEYQVIVSDQWSCSSLANASITIFEPITALATVDKTIDCTVGNEGGAITITQTGGSGSFDYEVRYPGTLPAALADDANTTGIFTGLTLMGDYAFTITDQDPDQACSVIIVQNLQAAIYPVLTVDSSADVTCNTDNDGSISVSVTDNGVGPYTFEIVSGDGSSVGAPILPSSNTPTTAIFNSLNGTLAGITYTIRATGTNNCFVEETQTIFEPEIIANVSVTEVQFGCTAGNNPDNATITVDAGITGGSGTFVRYEFINTDTATTVQDGANDSYTETDFAGGNYTINVYDDNGCIGSTTASITPFNVLQTATVFVVDPISCVNLGEDIRIDVVGSLSDSNTNLADYEFRLLPSGAFQASNLFDDLAAGSYAFEIRNVSTGCVISTTHSIEDPNTFDIVVNKLSDVQCFGGDGQVQFAITDTTYTGGFVWMIFDTNGTPADRSDDGPFILDSAWPDLGLTGPANVPAGTYLVEIRQSGFPECTQTEIFTITTPPAALTLAVSEESSPSCTDDQGRILVNPSGGQGPYTILLENTASSYSETQTGVSAYIFTGLAGDDYEITVTDALGCVENGTRTLITPQALTATIANTDLTCFNASTASVTATVGPRNITPPYLYQLLTYNDAAGTNLLSTSATQTGDNFQNLPAGFYRIRVTDDVGCEALTAIREITNPTEVSALLIRTSPLTCATGVELQLSATGGSGSYAYSEDNITFIPIVGNTVNLPVAGMLPAGTYRYYVRDETNGCVAVLSNDISEDPIEPLLLEIDATAAVINCFGDNTAIIYATATGALGDYRYSLFTDATLTTNYYSPGHFQTTGQFGNLPADTYYVAVSSSDCPPVSEQVIISQPTELVVDDTDDFTNPACFGDENGSIRVSLSGGAGGYQYAISPRLDQFFPTGEFTDLAPGDYTVIAQDQNGCFIELQYTIVAPELLEATGTATPEICVGEENGSISLTITGGTAPFRTALNSNSDADFVQDRVDFTDLASGDYIIVIRDDNDCEANVIISVAAGVNLNATVEAVYECTGDSPDNYVNITLEDSAVLGDVLYALDSTDPADMQLNPDFRNTAPGTHYIAIAHANGCIQTVNFEIENFEPLTLLLQNNELNLITAVAAGGRDGYTFFFNDIDNGNDNTYRINESGTYTVRVVDENGCEAVASIPMEFIDIEIPEFFTPGGDGLNERWEPKNQEAFPEILTIIFDRYGREIYRMGLNDTGWDGFYNTKALPSGDYWYVIKLRGENDPREFVGHFTLYR